LGKKRRMKRGGRKNRGSIIQQVVYKIQMIEHMGASRHKLKGVQMAQDRKAGKDINPARTPGISSGQTAMTYKRQACRFAEWARDRHGIRNITDVTPEMVKEYLQERQSAGDSPYSLHTYSAAINKVFDLRKKDYTTDLGYQLPPRKQKIIKRSRGDVDSDQNFSESKNQDLVNFCKAVGPRKTKELPNIKPKHISDDGCWVWIERGKGGGERWIRTCEGSENIVIDIKQKAINQGKDYLFDRCDIPSRMDGHGYRREYAQTRYKQLLQEMGTSVDDKQAFCKKYNIRHQRRGDQLRIHSVDKGRLCSEIVKTNDGQEYHRAALLVLSSWLGHCREGVVHRNYLR